MTMFVAPAVGSVAVWAALGMMLVAAAIAALISVAAMALNGDIRAQRWEALERYQPRFALYFSAPAGSEYQVQMWLPLLERIDEKWVIILRERRYLNVLASQTSAPVVVAASLSDVGQAMVPTLSTVFYVNNSFKNSHCVRYSDKWHIQLLHGDSDKVASFNPVTAMFDKVFVAGQAGIDRYSKNGVKIPREKFEIVGRPQIEGISVARPIGAVRESARPTVLYAPTWQGYHDDANFSSLRFARQIIRDLISSEVNIIFRPHPFSARHKPSAKVIESVRETLAGDSRIGASHRFGTAAEREISLVECMNLSDALVTDISSVPGDYLYSGKPFVIVKVMSDVPLDEFVKLFPLAGAAYVWDGDQGASLSDTIDTMLGPDPRSVDRDRMRSYYLGEFDARGYSENFVRAAKRYVASTKGRDAQTAWRS